MEKAKFFCNTFRAKLPLLYRARRRSDASTPSTSPTPSDRNDQHPNNSENLDLHSNEQPRENESHISNGNEVISVVDQNLTLNETDSFNLNDTNLAVQTNSLGTQKETANVFDENSSDETQVEFGSTLTHADELTAGISSELKPIMQNVEMAEEEVTAIEDVFDDCDDSASNQHTTEVNLSSDETAFWADGVLKVKKKCNEDLEMTYNYGEKFVPKIPAFEVKINDLISMNIPFKENVSF